jgi:hypothetical protein
MKLKNLLESTLGELPSSKLKKMKWNPVTQKEPVKEASPRMKKDPDVEKMREMINELGLIALSNVNRINDKYFKKAKKALEEVLY